MATAGQRLGVGRDLQQQRHHGELRFLQRAVLALERGERQQVIDQALHVLRLFLHQRQVALLLARIELHVG